MSEGTGAAPQVTCGIPRSRFGLVWLSPFDPVVFGEESPLMTIIVGYLTPSRSAWDLGEKTEPDYGSCKEKAT